MNDYHINHELKIINRLTNIIRENNEKILELEEDLKILKKKL